MNKDNLEPSTMSDFPRSLLEFQQQFPDDAACAEYLRKIRWPSGFVCPACGGDHGWELETRARTHECARCGKQTSLTAGTIMHGSKVPLTTWFRATYLMTTHSNGISALQLQGQSGIGSYKTAWLLQAKLRKAMVATGREPLTGLVEVDETEIRCRSKDDPPAGGGGRSHQGKVLLASAVEIRDQVPGRIRLSTIADFSARSLHGFIGQAVEQGATIKTDGWAAYPGAPKVDHEPHVVGSMAAHVVLPWVHRVFSNLKIWALGVYHDRQPLHDGRSLRPDRPRGDRPHSQHQGRLIMTSGHPTNYTTLTDVTPR